MPSLRKSLRLTILVLALTLPAPLRPAAASDNLVWWPYLQQVTDTSIIILWTTRAGANPLVRYAADTGYGQSAAGTSRPTPLDTQLHRVELTGLQPDTTYYYKIYVDNEDLLPDQTLSFQTATPPGSSAPFRFIAFGDYGQSSPSQWRLRDQMLRDSFRFILTTGDNAYDSGAYREFDTNVFRVYSRLFSRTPLFPILGNHDYLTNLAAPYLDIFDLPQNAWRPADRERYYSFDYGNAHFVALDSDRPLWVDDRTAADDMLDWLRDDLAHTIQHWKIVVVHVSPYSSGFHRGDSELISYPRLPPIFEAYGVDLVLSGHDHSYQRSHPLRSEQITPPAQGGVVYVVNGAGLMAGYPCQPAEWLAVAYCSQNYGLYSRVTVDGGLLRVEAVDEQGTIRDSFTLTKTLATPLAGLDLNGPPAGLLQAGQTFTVSTRPVTVTLPLTYTWQAEGQAPLTTLSGLGSTATFTWTTPGTYTVTACAADNQGHTLSRSYTIVISNAVP